MFKIFMLAIVLISKVQTLKGQGGTLGSDHGK